MYGFFAQHEAQQGLDRSYRDFYLMENPSYTQADAEEHMRGLIARDGGSGRSSTGSASREEHSPLGSRWLA
jgi:hypothetical protein